MADPLKILIILFNPAVDPDIFSADIYVNGERKFRGRGLPRQEAIAEAGEWIKSQSNGLLAR